MFAAFSPQRALVWDLWIPFLFSFFLRDSLRCLYRPIGLTPFFTFYLFQAVSLISALSDFRFPRSLLHLLILRAFEPVPVSFLIHRLSYGSLLCILCFPWIFRGLYFSLFSFRLWPVLGTHAFHFLFLVLSIASTWDSRLSCLLFSFLFDDRPFS
jgi:hypothetical protein